MNENHESETLVEEFVVKHHGYLRLPNAVKQKFGSFIEAPEPDSVDAKTVEGKLVVVYTWEIRKLLRKGE